VTQGKLPEAVAASLDNLVMMRVSTMHDLGVKNYTLTTQENYDAVIRWSQQIVRRLVFDLYSDALLSG
jgi:hypothetical protein